MSDAVAKRGGILVHTNSLTLFFKKDACRVCFLKVLADTMFFVCHFIGWALNHRMSSKACPEYSCRFRSPIVYLVQLALPDVSFQTSSSQNWDKEET